MGKYTDAWKSAWDGLRSNLGEYLHSRVDETFSRYFPTPPSFEETLARAEYEGLKMRKKALQPVSTMLDRVGLELPDHLKSEPNE